MDQLDSLYTTSKYLLPWSTFLIGLIGSMHCVGMCGGLVMSCSPTPANNISYQFGRLSSYSLLAVLSGIIGSYFSFSKNSPMASVIPAVIIGGMLIWIGLKHFMTKSNQLKLPIFIDKFIHSTWKRILPKPSEKVSKKNSFFIGGFSIMLPCGLLYGVILALGAFNSPALSLLCIFTFWIGTLPVMSFAPNVIKKVLRPLYQKMPVFSSAFMILIGVLTISHRVYLSYQVTVSCH